MLKCVHNTNLNRKNFHILLAPLPHSWTGLYLNTLRYRHKPLQNQHIYDPYLTSRPGDHKDVCVPEP